MLSLIEEALCRAFLTKSEIESYLMQLNRIRSSLDEEKERINSLLHRCNKRLLNFQIDQIADKAQNLLGKVDVEEAAQNLRKEIAEITEENALAFENRQMLLFARKLLQKVSPNGKRLCMPHDDEYGEWAFSVANELFLDHLSEVRLSLRDLPKWLSNELEEWVLEAGSQLGQLENIPDLETFYQNKWALIRGFLGFAMGELPTLEEAKTLFAELQASLETA